MTEDDDSELTMEIAGPFETVMEKINSNGLEGPISEYPELQEALKDMAEVLHVVERENGAIKSRIVDQSDRDLESVHMKSLLKYMRSAGLLELDGKTNIRPDQ